MKFFDYVFYRVCKAYSRTKDSSPEGAAVGVVSAMQCFTVLSFFMIVAIFKQNKRVLNLPIVITIMLFFLIFNYFRHIYKEDNNYEILKNKWSSEPNSYRRGVLIVIYIIITTAIFIGLAIYLGNKKW